MSNNKGFWFFRMVLIGLLFIITFITLVMLLWNWLMPNIFGLPTITFLQAGGLLLLSKLLFGFGGGNFGRPSHHKHKGRWKNKMREKWQNMSVEEKSDFKAKMKEKWANKENWCKDDNQ